MCVGPQINTCAKFCANIFNSKWIMNDKWNSKWRLQPSRIIFGWFWSPGLFSVAVDYITTKKFHLSVSVGGWVIAVCAWIQDGGRRHFRFYVRTIFSHMWMWDSKLNKLAKFCANMCNSKRFMGDKWNLKWWSPPSWIHYFCFFWLNGLFPVAVVYTHSSVSISGWVIAVCAKVQDGGRCHLEL